MIFLLPGFPLHWAPPQDSWNVSQLRLFYQNQCKIGHDRPVQVIVTQYRNNFPFLEINPSTRVRTEENIGTLTANIAEDRDLSSINSKGKARVY